LNYFAFFRVWHIEFIKRASSACQARVKWKSDFRTYEATVGESKRDSQREGHFLGLAVVDRYLRGYVLGFEWLSKG